MTEDDAAFRRRNSVLISLENAQQRIGNILDLAAKVSITLSSLNTSDDAKQASLNVLESITEDYLTSCSDLRQDLCQICTQNVFSHRLSQNSSAGEEMDTSIASEKAVYIHRQLENVVGSITEGLLDGQSDMNSNNACRYI